jgi:hypothetical protein
MRRGGKAIIAIAVAGGLAGAVVPTAAADDTSLRAAGQSRDGQFADLSERTTVAFRGWSDAGFSAAGRNRIVRLHRQTRRELRIVSTNIRSEQPSSENGADYKRLLLRSLRYFDAALQSEVVAVRARTAGRARRARSAFDRAGARFTRSVRNERAAIRAIERG